MKDREREHLEQRLIEERDRRVRALERLDEDARISTEDDGELTQYRQHPADEGTDTMEQEKTLMLLGREGAVMGEIDEALRRLYKEPETYGRCESCGRAIAFERLDVVPWARQCAECQTRSEAGG